MINASKVKFSAKKSNTPNLEDGSYPARLVGIVDLGLQEQKAYQGQEKPPINKVLFTYELCDEFMLNDGGEEDKTKPRWVSEVIPLFNLKADKAKSTKRYKVFDPEEKYEGDWSKLIESPCVISIINKEYNGKNYLNIVSVAAMRPKEINKLNPIVSKSFVFDLDNPNMDVYISLNDWVKDLISKGLTFESSQLYKLLNNEDRKDKEPEEVKDNEW